MKRIAHGDRCVNRSPVPPELPSERAGLRTRATEGRADLIAANARLLALRANRPKVPPSASTDAITSAAIPSHLGWGSQRLAIRHRQAPLETSAPEVSQPEEKSEPKFDFSVKLKPNATVRLYPTVATAILKSESSAIGRIWLLCRHLDQSGSGVLPIEQLRHALTSKNSPMRVVGWRRLRQLLTAGQGIFWQRRKTRAGDDRLWLYGWRRVCAALDVTRLDTERIDLPIKHLLGSMGQVRAALYATFHAGHTGNPISRQTLAEITGISERSQRQYDKSLAVDIRPNYSLIAPFSAETQRTQTYESATPHFVFTDYNGQHGPRGQRYTARQLPNSYQVRWQRNPSSQKRKLNQQLKQDLVPNGTQGNGSGFQQWERVFVTAGNKATGNHYIHDRGQFWIAMHTPTHEHLNPKTEFFSLDDVDDNHKNSVFSEK